MTSWWDRARQGEAPFALVLGAMLVLLLAVMCVAVSTGAYPVAPGELAALLWAKATKSVLPVLKAVETVIWDIRGPRVLAALLVGAGLAASGAAYQGAALQPAGLARHPRRLLGGCSAPYLASSPCCRCSSCRPWPSLAGCWTACRRSTAPTSPRLRRRMAVAPVPLMLLRWRLDVMTPGDEGATSLGVSVRMVRTLVIAAATLMTAAAVSVSGIVG